MKHSRAAIHRKFHRTPVIRFEDQRLTSFAGLVVFQSLFTKLDLKHRLGRCFDHLRVSPIFGHGVVVLLLIVHLLLGYRRLQELRYYHDDPLVRRLLGLSRLPDVATLSRTLAGMDGHSADQLRELNRRVVGDRLVRSGLRRLTLDFDGSVLATGRFAEGTAVGFNPKKKGQRSYYPLFCTIAQTGQVFDVWHRPGNVHDANGARDFMRACIREIRHRLPRAALEVRADGAFFSQAIVEMLAAEGVEFAIAVPFARFPVLKDLVEARRRWRRLDQRCGFFERRWKPKRWLRNYRFVFIRTRHKQRFKGPLQLDLFVPCDEFHDHRVVVTNKSLSVRKLVAYYHGRGAQEGVFAELKSQTQMDYVPTRRQPGNRVYVLAAMLAHNLNRELHMRAHPPQRNTTAKRAPRWVFTQLGTLRRRLIQRAGRLTRPRGRLTLTLSANAAVQNELLQTLAALDQAA